MGIRVETWIGTSSVETPAGDLDRDFLSGDSGFDGDSDRDFRVLDFDGDFNKDFNKDSEREFNSDLDEDFVTLEFLLNFTSNCASRL